MQARYQATLRPEQENGQQDPRPRATQEHFRGRARTAGRIHSRSQGWVSKETARWGLAASRRCI